MTIRIGILGAARIAPKAVIVPAHDNPDFEIVAVAARDKSRAQAFAAKHGIPQVADSYAELVTHPDVDLVYLALPTAAHRPWSMAALKAGKAVLCEKPFALDAGEARAMVQAADITRRPLIEAFHYRYHAVMRRAVEIAASGEMGRLVEAEAVFNVEIPYSPTELRWLPDQGGGGALMDLGCYCVHALRSIAGCEPAVTRAACRVVLGVDETTTAELSFPNGLQARLHTSMKAPAYLATLHVRGEKGSFSITNFLAPQMGSRFTVEVEGRTREEETGGLPTYHAQLAHVGDVMLRGVTPLTAGADAIANMACIDAIYNAGGYYRSWVA
ncbi:MAG: Gfo/Idh/MocA family oxidoreductase [Alphaproteobacteria bacterium]|nr:Gfo/Idh/MocA family oxidoreductase [Alphaproteobacteria bacterium]